MNTVVKHTPGPIEATFLVFFLLPVGCGGQGGGGSGKAPAAPSNLLGSVLAGGAHLTWTDNAADEDQFELQRRTGSAAFSQIALLAFDTVQFHDAGVEAGTSYVYRVRALAASGASEYSNEATVDMPAGPGGTGGNGSGTGGSGSGGAPGTGGSSGGGRTGTGGSGTGGAVGVISFQRDVVPIIDRRCGSADMACHARNTYFANSNMACRGWLALENAPLGARGYGGTVDGQATGCPDRTLYQRLTQLDAWMCDQARKYVVAGNVTRSHLFQMVAGDPTEGGTCFKAPGVPTTRMPPPSVVPPTAAEIDTLRGWISAGAPDN